MLRPHQPPRARVGLARYPDPLGRSGALVATQVRSASVARSPRTGRRGSRRGIGFASREGSELASNLRDVRQLSRRPHVHRDPRGLDDALHPCSTVTDASGLVGRSNLDHRKGMTVFIADEQISAESAGLLQPDAVRLARRHKMNRAKAMCARIRSVANALRSNRYACRSS